MPALYPASVAPENYQIGDNVRWFTNAHDATPYVGKVVAISPKTYKVWVTWPIGDTTQHSPEELILVPKYQGISVVDRDNGYSSYDKEQSAKYFGTLSPTARARMASKLSQEFRALTNEAEKITDFPKRAAKLASAFSEKVAAEVVEAAVSQKVAGATEMQAYSAVFDSHGDSLGDALVRDAIFKVYYKGG